MSALPSVAVLGAWIVALLDLRSTDLARRVAASNAVLAYARAYARAEGLDEAHAIVVAFEALRGPSGEHEAEAVEALGGEAVVWPALRLVEDRERDRAEEEEHERQYEAEVPWGGDV